jgi:hypothetical protein
MEYNGYKIVGLYGIHTIGRGSLPNALKGSFSSTRQAQIAIDGVLAEKAEKNGEKHDIG